MTVTCGSCKHLIQNQRGHDGVGNCGLNLPIPRGQYPHYPNAKRECSAWDKA